MSCVIPPRSRVTCCFFTDAGWALHSLRAFDLFPMTEHVETVAVVEPPQVRATNAL